MSESSAAVPHLKLGALGTPHSLRAEPTPQKTRSQRAKTEEGPLQAAPGEAGEGLEDFGYRDVEELLASIKENNDALDMYELAVAFDHGIDVSSDQEKAFSWYMKAAEEGHAAAQSTVGFRLDVGKGCEVDEKAAVEWYKKAASFGEPEAQFNLGACFHIGSNGLGKSASEALHWFEKSSALGFKEADAQIEVIQLEAAVKKGDPEAQFRLGCMYEDGALSLGVGEGPEALRKADLRMAAQLFLLSAKQGHPPGENALGLCYESGEGVASGPDIEAAAVWYQSAADKGSSDAQFNLASLYEYGKGVQLDYRKAFEFYKKAAEKGHVLAMDALSSCYSNGDGVDKNVRLAAKWMIEAAKKGYHEL